MQDVSKLQYANKKTLALIGTVTISIQVTDEIMPGMVWWDHKLYLPDESGNLYYLNTNPITGVPSTSLTKIATLSNFGGIENQLGFDFRRNLILYKQTGATTVYYIDINSQYNIGVYATASGTDFAGSRWSSNFFVDADGYMYLGISDNPKPDVRILKPKGTAIPITYELDRNIASTGTDQYLCDGLYPDPYDGTVIYTNNDDQTIFMYKVIGFLNLNQSEDEITSWRNSIIQVKLDFLLCVFIVIK